jgi:anti-sigma regulatory factor (Ser/Thr protein kinase)
VRQGAAPSHRGCFHEAALYGCDEDLLGTLVPFLDGGRAAHEPTLVLLDEQAAGLVRAAFGDTDGITFEPPPTRSTRPATALRLLRERLIGLVAQGAAQIRVAGQVPLPGPGDSWDRWARYEAAVNHVFDDLPLWGLCLYDTRTAPEAVLDVVAGTHPHLGSPDGSHRPNPRYQDPRALAAGLRGDAPFEVPPTVTAVIDLVDPSPRAARRAVAAACAMAPLDGSATADLLVAVSEVVTNAHQHGGPPVRLRAWVDRDRVVVTTTDGGPGPDDPLVGYLPRPTAAARGRGLWIVHQLCDQVTMHRGRDGFTVGIMAGTGPPAAPRHPGQHGAKPPGHHPPTAVSDV